MTHLEAKIRRDLLRDVLRSVRKTWACLASGDLLASLDHRNAAVRSLAYVNGLFAHSAPIGATCRLERAVMVAGMALDDAVGEALRPATEADLEDLIAEVACGVDVLRTRDGVVMEEAQSKERGRNIVASLEWRYRITRRRAN